MLILLSFAVVATGLLVQLLHGWGIGYGLNLVAHPLLGLVATVVALWAARGRLDGPARTRRVLIQAAPFVVAALAALPASMLSTRQGFAMMLALLLWAAGANVYWFVRHTEQPYAARLLAHLTGMAWALTLWSGLVILRVFQGGGVKHVFWIHACLGIGVFVPILVRFLLPFIPHVMARAFAPAARRPSRKVLFGIALIGLGVAAAVASDRRFVDPRYTIHLSTIPLEQRDPGARKVHFDDPAFPAAGIALTRSCTGAPGCHAASEQAFLDSNHNTAYMTPHFQKNLGMMESEIGRDNTLICAGCHTPLALFDRTKNYTYFKDHNNLSCSFCHMIADVHVTNDDGRRSNYTLEPPIRHLELFVKEGREVVPDALTQAMIRLSPLSHGQAFHREMHTRDEFCVVCHHHQIKLSVTEGVDRPKCIECHMQPQSELGGQGEASNHFMPGANLVVPTFTGRKAAVELVRKWLDGEYLPTMQGWENAWEPRKVHNEKLKRATWLYLLLDSESEPEPGKTFAFQIRTANVGMEHQFPAAALDLVEAWMHIIVRDATGRVLFRNGDLDARGLVPADAHTMGGYMVGMDEMLITRNRVWQIKKKVVHRVLAPGHDTTDDFSFAVPADVKGPLSVEVRWNYRKLNQDFVAWAYGPGVQAPIVSLGFLDTKVPLRAADAPAQP